MAERQPVAVPRASHAIQFGGFVTAPTVATSDTTEWGTVMTWPSPLQHLFERLRGSSLTFAHVLHHEDREEIDVILRHYTQQADLIEERLRTIVTVRSERERDQ